MNEQAEEVPFLSGMERKEEPTILQWRLDALHAKVDQLKEEVVVPVKETAHAAMEGLKAAMKSISARGPDPDADPQGDEDLRTIMRAFVDMAKHAQRPSYSNGGDTSGDLRKWIAGVGAALAAAFIIGAWTLSNQVASLTAKVEDVRDHQKATDDRLTRLEAEH